MHHGGEGLYWLVCFQYSSIKFLSSPLVHNTLLHMGNCRRPYLLRATQPAVDDSFPNTTLKKNNIPGKFEICRSQCYFWFSWVMRTKLKVLNSQCVRIIHIALIIFSGVSTFKRIILCWGYFFAFFEFFWRTIRTYNFEFVTIHSLAS